MNPSLSSDITVKALLDQYPELLKTFLALGFKCAGCPTEAFHTISDIAKTYGYHPEALARYFECIINKRTTPQISNPESD